MTAAHLGRIYMSFFASRIMGGRVGCLIFEGAKGWRRPVFVGLYSGIQKLHLHIWQNRNWNSCLEAKILYLGSDATTRHSVKAQYQHSKPKVSLRKHPSLNIWAFLWDSIFSGKISPTSKLKYAHSPIKFTQFCHLFGAWNSKPKKTSRLQSIHLCRFIFWSSC